MRFLPRQGAKRHGAGITATALTCLTALMAIFSAPANASTGLGGPQMLFTSSAAYCSPPEAILISALDLKFFRENRTLEFDISAASVQDDLRVVVSVDVNAYGLGLFSLSIDLCDTLAVLCPLPNYQFQGAGVFAVPQQFVDQIPTIAYTVPDLEAVATVQLRDTNNAVVGCVQATLSNGKTTYQPAAKWAVLGVLLLAFVSSLLHTVIASSLGAAQWRIVDVFTTIQHIVMAALLSLDYPAVYTQFARNFAWAVGLIDIPAVQRSILSTRKSTGGSQDGTFGTLLKAESGKQYNPFTSGSLYKAATPSSLSFFKLPEGAQQVGNSSYLSYNRLASPISFKLTSLAKRQIYAPNTGPGGQIAENSNDNYLPLISTNTPNPIGLGYFSELNNVSPASAFLTVLVSLAILFAILIGICLVIFAFASIVRLITRRRSGRAATWSSRLTGRSFLGMLCRPIFGRFLIATFQVFLVFAFWQWLRGDSWVPDFLAAVFLVVYLAGIFAIYFPVFRAVRRGSKEELFYGEMPPANASSVSKRWGAIAHPFRPKYFWFGLVFFLVYFIRAAFIGFGQGRGHALRQSIGLAATDLIFFLVLCICRPGRDKTSDFVMIVLLIFRVISWGLCIALTPLADIQTIPRVVLGFALIVVTGLPIIFLFFLTVWDLFSPFIRKRQWNSTRIGDAELDEKSTWRPHDFGAVGRDARYDGTQHSAVGTEPTSSGSSDNMAPSNDSDARAPMQQTHTQAAPTPAPATLGARPIPTHATSGLSTQSGQSVYYDARQTSAVV